jgi:hypothetical protein
MQGNKKGVAFLVVMSMVLMLLVLSAAVLRLSSSHFGSSFQQIDRARAYYAAEAAMHHALTRCRLGAAGGYDLPNLVYPYTDPAPPTIFDPNYSLVTKIVILLPGTNLVVSADEQYSCPAGAPSDYCVFTRVAY